MLQLIGENVTEVNGIPISAAPGSCKSKNFIYLVSCRLCNKPYFGRTVQYTHKRMSGHRECYYKVLRADSDVDELSDDYSLGLHLANEYHCTERADFDKYFNLQLV